MLACCLCCQDVQRRGQLDSRRKVRRDDRDQREMERLRQHFGGGPDADRLAQTLKKLKLAYQEGKTMMRKKSPTAFDDDSEYGISDY